MLLGARPRGFISEYVKIDLSEGKFRLNAREGDHGVEAVGLGEVSAGVVLADVVPDVGCVLGNEEVFLERVDLTVS